MSLPDLLALDHVSHAYRQHAVVRDLSFVLNPGEIGCLLGASGCGKTTVLRLIAGFETPTQGAIRLRDAIVGAPRHCVPPERRNIGFGLRAKSALAGRHIDDLLALVGLSGQGGKYPHELSGGQQQRVALARALAPRPHLLLLDEPFSNLDVELRERLSLEVRAILKETGTAAILVTHDQHEAFAVADVVGIMHAGRIEQWDTPYNLYHRPTTRHVADFVGQGVFLPGRVLGAATVDIELGTLGCRLPRDVAGDETVDILLRPDDIMHDDNAPTQAEVVAKAFRGAEFLYTLQLPSGARVLSLVPSHHNHAIGEMIGIRLDVDHVVAFRHDSLAVR